MQILISQGPIMPFFFFIRHLVVLLWPARSPDLNFQDPWKPNYKFRKFTCSHCPFWNTSLVLYIKHIRTHKADYPHFRFHCCLCLVPKRFTNIRAWQRHIQSTHSIENVSSSISSHYPGWDICRNSSNWYSILWTWAGYKSEAQATETEYHGPQPGASNGSIFMVASFLNSLRDLHLPESACAEVAKCVENIGKQIIREN